MSTIIVRRPRRRKPPEFPQGELALQEPPPLPESQGGQISTLLMYLPMAASSAVMVLMFVQPGGANRTMMYLASGMMVVSMLAMGLVQLGRASSERKLKVKGESRDYLRYLGQVRKKVRQAITAQRTSMLWMHPEPGRLWAVANSDRLWERRPNHHDFGEVRIGVGPQRLSLKLQAPQTKPVEDLEPLCASALRRFMHAYGTVDDLPMAVYLRTFARILLRGEPDVSRAMVRAMVMQLATFHSADDVRIAVCASGDRLADWDWLKWLPHALHPTEHDGAGPLRLVVDNWQELEGLLGEQEFTERTRFDPAAAASPTEPYIVIVLDGAHLPEQSRPGTAGYRNTTVVDVDGSLPWKATDGTLRLDVAAETIQMVEVDQAGTEKLKLIGRPDQLGLAACRRLAHTLAPFRAGVAVESTDVANTDIELTTLLGAGDPRTVTTEQLWTPRSPWDFLRVPIGVTDTGSPVELDIKESAQGGMGPHGILIGATGSGKSELLRTLVLSMSLTHSSEVLNFVLVDFKGGATFAGLDTLPHVSAFITNLADELSLVDRMQDSLHGELVRRQEALRAAGYSSVTEYEKARVNSNDLEPFPTLFVVVDEFGELLATKSEFMDLFVMIGRLGRSLGVHLLLASQRLEEGRISSLETHLSYRVGLRMFSAMESRSVLGVNDAYEEPLQAGSGFLRTDTTTLVKFKGAYVSGPCKTDQPVAVRRAVAVGSVVPYGVGYVAPLTPHQTEPVEPEIVEDDPNVETVLQVLVRRLRGEGVPARRIWLPPLDVPPTLDEVLPETVRHPQRGFGVLTKHGAGRLAVPVGVVDKPFDQKREPLVADLAGGKGHVGIAGGPQMGKSSLIRTLVSGLALTHTPAEAQFYILDFGGGGLAGLADLPHVGSIAGRLEKERVQRTVAELGNLLTDREKRFAELRIDSMATYRKMRASGQITDDPFGDVFLVVDGWFTLHQEYEDLESTIQEIASRGLSYGIHLIVAATRWSEIRPWLRDLLGTRFELCLGDSIESEMDFRAAKGVPQIPGRGLTKDKYHCQMAVSRVDGQPEGDPAEGTQHLVARIKEAWTGQTAPPVRMLPTTLSVSELPAAAREGMDLKVAFGVDDTRLEPVWHDFGVDPHLLIFGDVESGKSNLLRIVARGIAERFTPSEARVVLADQRRQLHTAIPPEYVLGTATSPSTLSNLMKEIAASLSKRVPASDIAPDRIPKRDWWRGPQLFVLVDDYELLASPMSPSLDALTELSSSGVEIGLHLVVSRSSVNAGRGMGDPTLRRLWEGAAPGLLLSARKDEGPFLGDVRPRQLPAGRAQLINRRRVVTLVQTALVPAESQAAA